MTTYLLITGGRAVPAAETEIRAELDATVEEHGLATLEDVVVVHGACPHQAKGCSVDAVADRWALDRGWRAKPMPAAWRVHPPGAAGPIRNGAMVAFVAAKLAEGHRVLVIALPTVDAVRSRGSGTWDCITKARRADLQVDVRRRFIAAPRAWTGKAGEQGRLI